MREARKNRITVVMGDSLMGRLQELADDNDRSMSDFIRLICKDYCEALDGDAQVILDNSSS